VGEHCSFEVAQLGSGFEAQVVSQELTDALEGCERVPLAAGAEQRQHQLRVEMLTVRMGADEIRQLVDDVDMAP
jgi:hypothetical protein